MIDISVLNTLNKLFIGVYNSESDWAVNTIQNTF